MLERGGDRAEVFFNPYRVTSGARGDQQIGPGQLPEQESGKLAGGLVVRGQEDMSFGVALGPLLQERLKGPGGTGQEGTGGVVLEACPDLVGGSGQAAQGVASEETKAHRPV
jgi:hypothetical protein